MDIHYLHRERKITKSHFDALEGNEISFEDACALMDSGEAKNCNVAFLTLRDHGGDMEAVEEYYQSV